VSASTRQLGALFVLALAACGESAKRDVETIILCVWDGVDEQRLGSGAPLPGQERNLDPPSLAELFSRDSLDGEYWPATESSSAALASLLSRSSVEVHGLRSVAELGAQRIAPAVQTLAEELRAAGWRTLASASEAHFEMCGLARGFDVWHAPKAKQPRSWRPASEVLTALEPDLEAALATDQPVFVWLHFGDLRADRWRAAEPSAALLESYLQTWRHGDELIDAVFEARGEAQSLAERLRTLLMRRTDDPRRTALIEALYAGALAELDGKLAAVLERVDRERDPGRRTVILCGGPAGDRDELGEPGARRKSRLFRRGKWLGLDEWFAARRLRPPVPLASAAQGVSISSRGAGLEGLRVLLSCAGADFQPWGTSDTAESLQPTLQTSLQLAAHETRSVRLTRRGASFSLRFKHEQLFQLAPADVSVGSRTLADCDVPELVASQSPRWPENALVGPVLDLQSAGQRRLRGRVEAAEGARVELLVESFPTDLRLAQGIDCTDCSVTRHMLRPGAAWIQGRAPLEFVLPPRSPADRLGIVLRIDGARLSSSRIRYLGRVLSAPDTLELGFSAGAWLDAGLRGPGAGPGAEPLRLELLDELPASDAIELPSPDELEYLQRLDEDE
jgi:hypothetical protein